MSIELNCNRIRKLTLIGKKKIRIWKIAKRKTYFITSKFQENWYVRFNCQINDGFRWDDWSDR